MATLLLPYLGFEDIYNRYDFAEAWDSPKNLLVSRDVSEQVAPLFQCPNDRTGQGEWTSFLALRTNGAQTPDRLAVTEDRTLRIIPVIFEIHGSKIRWMEPKDLPAEAAETGLVHENPESGVVNFLGIDGQVYSIMTNQLLLRNSEREILERLLKAGQDNRAQ